MYSVNNYSEFDPTGWCFRDVNFGGKSDDVERTLKNLKQHILKGVLSPSERGLWATIKNIPSLNSCDEICVSYGAPVWSLFGTSDIQVMFPLDIKDLGVRITEGNTSILHTRVHVVTDKIDKSKRQVQAILSFTRNDDLRDKAVEIGREHNIPVYINL